MSFKFGTSLSYLANGVCQIGYVIPDVGKPLTYFIDTMGVAGFRLLEDAQVRDQTYHGRPTESCQHLAFGYAGTLNIGLIQPIEGRNTHTNFLDEHPGGGLHHLGVKVHDYERALGDA